MVVKSHNLLVRSGFKEGGEGNRDERKNVVRDNKYLPVSLLSEHNNSFSNYED